MDSGHPSKHWGISRDILTIFGNTGKKHLKYGENVSLASMYVKM